MYICGVIIIFTAVYFRTGIAYFFFVTCISCSSVKILVWFFVHKAFFHFVIQLLLLFVMSIVCIKYIRSLLSSWCAILFLAKLILSQLVWLEFCYCHKRLSIELELWSSLCCLSVLWWNEHQASNDATLLKCSTLFTIIIWPRENFIPHSNILNVIHHF